MTDMAHGRLALDGEHALLPQHHRYPNRTAMEIPCQRSLARLVRVRHFRTNNNRPPGRHTRSSQRQTTAKNPTGVTGDSRVAQS
jgi:hypothetical protein